MLVRSIIAILILAASGVYAGMLRQGRPAESRLPDFEMLPRQLQAWSSQDFEQDATTAEVLAADATLHRSFRRADGSEVGLFIAYFQQQQVNAQIHSPRNCIPGGGWVVRSLAQETIDLAGRPQPVTRMVTARKQHTQDVLYWFNTHDKSVPDEYSLKWQQVRTSILRHPTNAAFIRFTAASRDSVALHEIMTLLDQPLQTMLHEVGLQ